MINLNLVKSIPNKKIRADVVKMLYGSIPCDGKTRSIKTILENPDRYSKMTSETSKKDSQKRGF